MVTQIVEAAAPSDGMPTLDRRQRRWLVAHDRLYEAACELFLETDFVTTSVDEIAERADVARKTAFNHFPRKRDFVAEWGRRRRAHVELALSAELLAQPRIETVLGHYFDELARINIRQRALTIRMLHGWRESGGPFDADPHELKQVFESLITAAIARGEITAEISPPRVATLLYSSYFGLLYDWCEGADTRAPFNLRKEFARLVAVVLDGLHRR